MTLKVDLDQSKWTAAEKQQLRTKGYRVRREGELPCVSMCRPDGCK